MPSHWGCDLAPGTALISSSTSLSHHVSHALTPATLTFLLFLVTLNVLPILPPASKLSGPLVWPFLVFRAVGIFLTSMFQLKSPLLRQTQQR